MKRFGLAMLDVDGTLRGEADWMPGALDLLARLGASGTPIALCSGRPVDSLTKTAADHPEIGYLAPGSGSMALRRDGDTWVPFAHRYLPPVAVNWTVNRAAEIGMEVWAYTDTTWLVAEITPRVKKDVLMTGAEPVVAELGRRFDVIKLLIFATRPEHDALVAQVRGITGFAVVSSYPGYLDIVHADSAATKGGDFLTHELGLTWADVVAAGDGENDLGMLAKAGVACCMPPLTQDALAPLQPGQLRRDCPGGLPDVIDLLESL